MKRTTKKLLTEKITNEEAETVFAEYAASDAKIQLLTAKMDGELTRIREKYHDELMRLAEAKTGAFAKLQHFATASPQHFTKRKSFEMTHGTIGFRTGTPALKTLKGITWEAAKNLVKEFLPDFVRVKEEVDKESLLAHRDDKTVNALFAKCGIKVEQSETFFVEPKKSITKSIA